MISVNVDLTKATQEEVEYFFRLPHVGHAVDVLSHVDPGVVSVCLLGSYGDVGNTLLSADHASEAFVSQRDL